MTTGRIVKLDKRRIMPPRGVSRKPVHRRATETQRHRDTETQRILLQILLEKALVSVFTQKAVVSGDF